jgi:predicted hotdog family 3-hydroxylacyl-ACP dehydratase
MTPETQSHFEQLLPHRPPMLMLTTMLEQDADSVHCSSVIAATNPLLSDGLFPVMGGVELLAQAAGTLFGARAPAMQRDPAPLCR